MAIGESLKRRKIEMPLTNKYERHFNLHQLILTHH